MYATFMAYIIDVSCSGLNICATQYTSASPGTLFPFILLHSLASFSSIVNFSIVPF